KLFRGYRSVYIGAIFFTALISLVEGAAMLGFPVEGITSVYKHLPLFQHGVGWIVPAVVGAVLGWIWGAIREVPRVK
ncbi:MAG TPA: branched-chain amino acid transport system II carrier protein, partial [Brevibacillus sp.]|nr:branched-chain amino acid transport system II carrier protein [Brevibacillus sp.]